MNLQNIHHVSAGKKKTTKEPYNCQKCTCFTGKTAEQLIQKIVIAGYFQRKYSIVLKD